MARQEQIDLVNRLVEEYKIQGNQESLVELMGEFDKYLKKQASRFCNYYKGVHSWETAVQEARVIFYNLVKEFTIGGDAYFTVYIQRKLPLRLRYFFIKEIKRRSRDLSYSDEQFKEKGLLGEAPDEMNDVLEDIDNQKRLNEIYEALDNPDVLTDRERDMVIRNLIHQESHESIAREYGISRSRVSRIIKSAIEKLQYEVKWRD